MRGSGADRAGQQRAAGPHGEPAQRLGTGLQGHLRLHPDLNPTNLPGRQRSLLAGGGRGALLFWETLCTERSGSPGAKALQ